MNIVSAKVEAYLAGLAPEEDDILLEMERYGVGRDFPIVGPLVGRLLCQLARMVKARLVFEMGSGFGYSAYWFLRGLPRDGAVICCEGSAGNAAKAKRFFERAGLADRVRIEVGDALEIIDRTPGEFDIVFNDVDKEDYPIAFRKALPRVRLGGLLIADNALWYGDVLKKAPREASTRGVKEYTRLAFGTPGLLTTIIPLRDGVAVSLKLG